MLATPSDVARFGGAHLASGYLSGDVLGQMMTPQSTSEGEATRWASHGGWGEDRQDRPGWHHAGNQAGARALIMIWPEHGVVVAVCTNLSGTPRDIRAHGESIAAGFLI